MEGMVNVVVMTYIHLQNQRRRALKKKKLQKAVQLISKVQQEAELAEECEFLHKKKEYLVNLLV